MAIEGGSLRDKNVRLRFLIYIFFGIAAVGSVLYWRTQALESAEYVEFTNSTPSRGGAVKTRTYAPNGIRSKLSMPVLR